MTDLSDLSERRSELGVVSHLASDPLWQSFGGAGTTVPSVTQHHTGVVVPGAPGKVNVHRRSRFRGALSVMPSVFNGNDGHTLSQLTNVLSYFMAETKLKDCRCLLSRVIHTNRDNSSKKESMPVSISHLISGDWCWTGFQGAGQYSLYDHVQEYPIFYYSPSPISRRVLQPPSVRLTCAVWRVQWTG